MMCGTGSHSLGGRAAGDEGRALINHPVPNCLRLVILFVSWSQKISRQISFDSFDSFLSNFTWLGRYGDHGTSPSRNVNGI
jgi:hypothetical protein